MYSANKALRPALEPLESRLLLDATVPTIEFVELNGGAAQRSCITTLALRFSEDVTVAKDDLTLYDYAAESSVDLTGAGFNYDGGTHTATWDLSSIALSNAYHLARLSAANVRDADGHHLDGDGSGVGNDDWTYEFVHLAGDANGDAAVNVGDLGVLGTNYGLSGPGIPGDMNNDGAVNIGDLGILGVNYGSQVAVPGFVTVIEDGVAMMDLVTAAVTEPVTLLQGYLQQITGTQLTVMAPAPGQTGLHVGKASDFPYLSFDDVEGLGEEGFIIQSDGESLFLIAKEDLGVQHAVNTFLESLGCRWYFPGSTWEVVPSRDTIAGRWNERHVPDLSINRRHWYGYGAYSPCAADHTDWKYHNKLDGPVSVSIGHTWYGLDLVQDFIDHPEWFALVGGIRQTSKPCYTDPGLIQHSIDWAMGRAASMGGQGMISLSPSDGLGFCECDDCFAVFQGGEPFLYSSTWFAYRPDGELVAAPSETVFSFVNQVAEAVTAVYPNILFGCYNYSSYSHPPSFNIHPSVFVQATTAYRRTPLTLDEQLTALQERADNVGIREYWSVYQWDYDWPDPGKMAMDRLQSDLQFYESKDVEAINAESSNNWAPRGLGYYVGSKLFWDVNTDVQALTHDFYEQAFGPAAYAMERYYVRWYGDSAAAIEDPENLPDKAAWSEAALIAAYQDLDEAAQLVEGLPGYRDRVDHIRMYAHYLFLRRQLEIADAAGDDQAIIDAIGAETVFGGRLTYTNMIHSRPLIGEAFDRRFSKWMNLLLDVPEAQQVGTGWRVVGTPPDHAEMDDLWAVGKAMLGLVDQPPAAPSNLIATATEYYRVQLSWTDNTDLESCFKIERADDDGFGSPDPGTWQQIATVPPNQTTYDDETVAPETTYHYRLRASNVIGDSAYSNTDDATTPAGVVPAAPTGLDATAAAWDQINLAWTDNSDNEDGFKIERADDNGSGEPDPATWAQIDTVPANQTTYYSSGLQPLTTYHYRVRAHNAFGDSAYSNVDGDTTPSSGGVLEEWTGSNGAPWPAAWSFEGVPLTYNIQDNTGHSYNNADEVVAIAYYNAASFVDSVQKVSLRGNSNGPCYGLIARRADDAIHTYYTLETGMIGSDYPSNDELYIRRYVDGVRSTRGTAILGANLGYGWYDLKFSVATNGAVTELKGKIWLTGEPEPETWNIQVTDSHASLQGVNGRGGLWLGPSGNRHIYADNYTAEPVGGGSGILGGGAGATEPGALLAVPAVSRATGNEGSAQAASVSAGADLLPPVAANSVADAPAKTVISGEASPGNAEEDAVDVLALSPVKVLLAP